MEIEFWEDSNGVNPVWEFIKKSDRRVSLFKKLELYEKQDLNGLLRNGSATEFKGIKSKYGFSLFELKPKPNRILFVALICEDRIFLVHAFIKKSKKTQEKEINKALCIAIKLKQKYKLR